MTKYSLCGTAGCRRQKGNKVNPDIKGVWFEKEYQRNYPFGSLASSVIGFTSSGNVGTTGLENYYNSTLNGINGREYGYLDSDSDFEKRPSLMHRTGIRW